MNIDLGDIPLGTPPTDEQQRQMSLALNLHETVPFLRNITGFVGGTASDLNSLNLIADTIENGGDIGKCVRFKDATSELIETYLAVASNAAQSVAEPYEVIRPSNYADVTNEIVFQRVTHAYPSTLTVDYFTTTDQTGLAIPADSYGHKGGIPFFGNQTLIEASGFTQSAAVTFNAFAPPEDLYAKIAEFPVPAAEAVDLTAYYFDIEIFTSGQGTGPYVAPTKLYLIAKLGAGPPDLTSGTSWIELQNVADCEYHKFTASVGLAAGPTLLRTSLLVVPPGGFFSHSISAATPATTLVTHLPVQGNSGAASGTENPLEDSTLSFYLLLHNEEVILLTSFQSRIRRVYTETNQLISS